MTEVNPLLEMIDRPIEGAALDLSKILTLSESEIVIAKIIAEETEKDREQQKKQIDISAITLGLGINPYRFINSQSWEDLLASPSVVEACSERAGISVLEVIDFSIEKCASKRWKVLFWMRYAYRFIEKSQLLDSDLKALQESINQKLVEEASRKGRVAAEARHGKPGGAWDLKDQIRERWASGNFATREQCVEQEWEGIGFGTMGAARRALQGTPTPNPWPAKKEKKVRKN